MAKIYIVRHGQTDENVKGVMTARDADYGLNDLGIRQAQDAGLALKKFLDGRKFDKVFSSPMRRAVETAQIICRDNFDGEIQIDDRLIERDAGEFVGKRYKPFDKAEFDLAAFFRRDTKFVSAEAMPDVEARAHGFINDIKKKYPNKNILVASHHNTSQHFKTYIAGCPADGNYATEALDVGHCEIIEIDN